MRMDVEIPKTPTDSVHEVAARLQALDAVDMCLDRRLRRTEFVALASSGGSQVVRTEVAILGPGEEERMGELQLIDEVGRACTPYGGPSRSIHSDEFGLGCGDGDVRGEPCWNGEVGDAGWGTGGAG